MNGDRIISPISWDSSFNWGLGKIQTNTPLALETEHLNSYGTHWRNMEGGSFTTLQSLPQCHAAFSTTPSTLAWVDQTPLASVCRSNPHWGKPSTILTASHVTQGRVRIHDTLRYERWVGFMGGDSWTGV